VVTKNISSPILWKQKTFPGELCGDQFIFLTPYAWQLKVFTLDFGHPIHSGLISTIDLATKFGDAW
jgi:hypothetical protein